MTIRIGVLVTNHNSWDLAGHCVAKNRALCGEKIDRLLLVDDCSTTPSPPPMDCEFELIRNESHLGFAKTLNKGVRALGTDIVVIFDADAFPLHDYVDAVRAEFEQAPALAALGFRTVDREGKPTSSCLQEPSALSLILGQRLYAIYQAAFEKNETRSCLTTCALAVRSAAFTELGGFDEELDWLDVDLSLSMKINRSHWRLKAAPRIVAFHQGGGTPTATAQRVLSFYQNRWPLLRKFDKLKNPPLAKRFIVARLRFEYLVLRLAGTILFRDTDRRLDKIAGRKAIIHYCLENYQV